MAVLPNCFNYEVFKEQDAASKPYSAKGLKMPPDCIRVKAKKFADFFCV